jgi:hypothetical protein
MGSSDSELKFSLRVSATPIQSVIDHLRLVNYRLHVLYRGCITSLFSSEQLKLANRYTDMVRKIYARGIFC